MPTQQRGAWGALHDAARRAKRTFMGNPNPIAFLMLAIWPFVVFALFRKLPPSRALIASMLSGYLLLPPTPAAFDFPLMPPLNKHTIPAFTAFILCMFDSRTRVSLFPESNIARVLIVVFVFSPVITVITNEEPVFFGQVGLPGLRWNDAIALIIQQFLLVLPLLLARQFLNTPQSHRDILVALIFGALGYSLLMLIEIRVSPQLNLWVYGFFPSSFAQSIRFGGYRPVVFLYHGLWVAFYVMTAVVAAFAMWRISDSDKSKNFLVAAMYLGTVLVMAKSTGAVLFAIMLVPMVVLLSPIMQIRVAALVALLAIGYPLAKGADIVPVERMLGAAAAIDPDRAASLEFRFDNENILMERAYIKPAFGWGSWGRNHILDPVSGNILTVTDGRWIIVIGVFGWIGFLAEFGLLTIPIFLLWREAILPRRDPVAPYIAPLSLILAFNIADMIPNATLTPLTWMMSGALLAYAEVLKAQRLGQGPIGVLNWRSIL